MRQTPAEISALDYCHHGWSVVPVRPRSKRPLVRWLEYQHRLPGVEEIREWFSRWPDANVAIVTGRVSGLIVIDVDPQHHGDASIAALEEAHGALPASVESVTGGGGRHVYFAHPGGTVGNRAGVVAGVDVRGDGGYVIAPPSVHPSGEAYRWRRQHAPGELPVAPMPAWLVAMIGDGSSRRGRSVDAWRALIRAGVPAGTRNATVASLTGHLLWHGVDAEIALELLLCWNRVRCRPPLSDDEVIRTVDSITRLHDKAH